MELLTLIVILLILEAIKDIIRYIKKEMNRPLSMAAVHFS